MKKPQFFHPYKGFECLNCGHPLNGEENFCPECGQKNDLRKISVKEIILQFFSGFFAFDNLFFRTLKPLILHPGKVSKDFIAGKRKMYSNPFQLFLHVSIIFFITINLIASFQRFSSIESEEKEGISKQTDLPELYTHYNQVRFNDLFIKNLDSIDNHSHFYLELKNPSNDKNRKDSIFEFIHEFGVKLVFPKYDKEKYIVDVKDYKLFSQHYTHTTLFLKDYLYSKNINYQINEKYFQPIESSLAKTLSNLTGNKKLGIFTDFYNQNKELIPNEALDSLHVPKTTSNLFLYQKAAEINKLTLDKEFRQDYFNSVLSNTSLALFILLPLFTFIFWLIYIRSNYTYSEHLVFVFNIQTVFFILLLVSTILDKVFKTELFTLLAIVIFTFYLYKSLRNFYGQNRIKTLLKYLFINFFYLIFGIIGFLVVSFLVFLL